MKEKYLNVEEMLASITQEIANYHEQGTKAIEKAFKIYQTYFGGEYEDFYEKIDISEIDRIDFMYDTDKEEWASQKELADWGRDTLNIKYF